MKNIGNNSSNPFPINVDTYYGDTWGEYFDLYDVRYLTFNVQKDEIYFIYLDSEMWWDLELYDDSNYTILLGTPYPVAIGGMFDEYLLFSPNRSDTYYLRLIQTSGFNFGIELAVLTANLYSINTSKLIIIGESYNPIQIFQVDLEAGNYSASYDALYAVIERGSNYVVFEEAYRKFPTEGTFSLDAGSYGIIFEESCEFTLTYYPLLNETPPDNPPNEPPPKNDTDTEGIGSFLDRITPLFGIGVIIGILVVYKVKKK
ncbi:MAG: hypothetical protein ACFFD2_00775 [Promethearchaeota archaeon]